MSRSNGALKAKLTVYTDGDAISDSDLGAGAAQPELILVARANHKDVVETKALDRWSEWGVKVKTRWGGLDLHRRFKTSGKDASGVACIDKPVHGKDAEKAPVVRPPGGSRKAAAIAVSVDANAAGLLQEEEDARIRTEEVGAWRHQLNALSEQEREGMERDWDEAVRDDWEEEKRERKENEMVQDDLRCKEAQVP